MNESLAIMRLAAWFDGHWCFPNVAFGCSEIDLAVVTRGARLLWEIEVKMNMADWRKDAQKRKWTDSRRQYVARMYYAVLPEMLDGPLLPAHVSPDMGLLTFTPNGHVREVRPARSRRAPKLPDQQMRAWLESTYHRFWRERAYRHLQARRAQTQPSTAERAA